MVSRIRSVAHDTELIKTPREVFTWRLTNGIQDHNRQTVGDCKQPLKALELIEKHDRPCIVVLQDFHVYFGVAATPQEGRKEYIKETVMVPDNGQAPDYTDDVRFNRGGRTIDF